MPKFIVRGEKPKEEIVEFWLEVREGDLWLCAAAGLAGESRVIATIRSAGALRRSHCATGIPGLQYDDKGRIREVE